MNKSVTVIFRKVVIKIIATFIVGVMVIVVLSVNNQHRVLLAQSPPFPDSLDGIKLPPFIVEDNTPTTENHSCTMIVEPGKDVFVDGSSLSPGDTICLNAGEYWKLQLCFINGADGNPIVVRNNGGKVIVKAGDGGSGGQWFSIEDSSNVRLTGTGDPNIKYGIYSITGLVSWNESTKIEVDHLELSGAWINFSGSSDDPDFIEENYYIHHNYVYGHGASAIYLGEAHHADQFVNKNCDISYNIIVDSAWKGIQFKSSLEGGMLHHNFIYNTCFGPSDPSEFTSICAAINITHGSNVEVYNNVIIKNGSVGIIGGDSLYPHNIYNNLIVDMYKATGDGDAFLTWGGNYQIFNNTIVGAARFGINLDGSSGENCSVFNNIIVDNSSDSIHFDGSPGEDFNSHYNLTKENGYTKDSVGFVKPTYDVSNYDYHLTEGSPAIDAGVIPSSVVDFDLVDDLEGAYRPKGTGYDIGAYEYVGEKPPIPGDLNNDEVVDIFDLVIVGNCFGREAVGDCERADANDSGGIIDIFDLVMVGSHFGN